MDKDITRATTHRPGLQVEIVHQRPSDNVEQISIKLQAVPSFEAFGPANLFAFWFRLPR
jgi:hypothetical protein